MGIFCIAKIVYAPFSHFNQLSSDFLYGENFLTSFAKKLSFRSKTSQAENANSLCCLHAFRHPHQLSGILRKNCSKATVTL